MQYDSTIPIYQQMADVIKKLILSGKLAPGDRIRSVRDLAAEFGVNPNTAQRALAALEGEGLIRTERNSGRFVTDDTEIIQVFKDKTVLAGVESFIKRMSGYGYDIDDIILFFQRLKDRE